MSLEIFPSLLKIRPEQIDLTLPTMADLVSGNYVGPIAYVQGYSAPHDGGEGLFYMDLTDTTTPDNGGTVLVDSKGRRWKRVYSGMVNVRWFGAKGDGISDDAPSIQKAIDYAASKKLPIIIPPGKYGVGQTIILPEGTRIHSTSEALLRPLANVPIITTEAHDVYIDGLYIDGNNFSGYTSSYIVVNGNFYNTDTYRFHWRNVIVRGHFVERGGTGIEFNLTHDKVSLARFDNVGLSWLRYGIKIVSGPNTYFNGNYFNGLRISGCRYGIYLASNGLGISGNTFLGVQFQANNSVERAIYATATGSGSINENYFHCMLWDWWSAADPMAPAYEFNSSDPTKISSNIIVEQLGRYLTPTMHIAELGPYNQFITAGVQTAPQIHTVIPPSNYRIHTYVEGNDYLAYVDKYGAVTQTEGSPPSLGSLSNAFRPDWKVIRWTTGPVTIEIDMGVTTSIRGVGIAFAYNEIPPQAEVSYWDGSQWVSLGSVNGLRNPILWVEINALGGYINTSKLRIRLISPSAISISRVFAAGDSDNVPISLRGPFVTRSGGNVYGLLALQQVGVINPNTYAPTVSGITDTLIRKLPVYDSSGNVIGYIPIYNNIT